jgi:hypothetical protein
VQVTEVAVEVITPAFPQVPPAEAIWVATGARANSDPNSEIARAFLR